MSFGGVIKLQGESAYRKAIKNINQSMRVLGSELKKAASEFSRNDKSVENLTAQNKILNKNVDEQKKKIATLKGALEDAKKEYGEDSSQVKNWQTQLNNAEAQLNKLNRQVEENEKDIKAANAETAKAKTPYETLSRTIKEQEQKLAELKTAYKNATLEGKSNDNETKQLAQSIKHLSAELNENKAKMNAAENAADRLGKSAKASGEKAETAANGGFTVFRGMLANIGGQAISRAIGGIKQLGKSMIDAGMNFEQAMSQVEAISGASGKELTALTDKAREMGAKTKFSATESAEAFNYMAMAGWKTSEMLNGIEGIMSLAAASNQDLASTSDIVTDALTAMGYSAGDATKLADVMASASANANTNVKLMGSTFQYAAPIVGALKYTMEDTAVAIGLMANAGIKGDKAGTSLRATLTRLAAPPKACAEEMERLNLSMTDGSGKMKPLRTLIDELRAKFKGMSESEQAAAANNIAGKNAMSGLLAIVNAAPADYNKLKKAVDNSTGSAAKMSKTMQNNVAGTMTKLKSQIEGVQIEIFKKLAPSFQSALKQASKFVKGINWDSFGNTVKGAFNKALDGLKWIIQNKDMLINGIKLMIAAFAVNKIWQFTKSISDAGKSVVSLIANIIAETAAKTANTAAEGTNTGVKIAAAAATGTLTAAQTALNVAMTANPVGVVVAALGALVAIIGIAVASTNQMTDAEKKHQEQVEKTTQAVTEAKDEWQSLEKERQNTIDKGETEISHYQSLWGELKNITDENGKVKKGYEERAAFITDTLSQALDTEIKMTGNVVENYKAISNKINEIIEKKKAKIILDAQEAEYKQAIKDQEDATRRLAKAESERAAARKEADKLFVGYGISSYKELESEIAATEVKIKNTHGVLKKANEDRLNNLTRLKDKYDEQTAAKEKNYNDAANTYKSYVFAIGQYEKNLELFHAGNYSKMSKVTWKYVKNYQKAGDAERKMLEDNISNQDYNLKQLRKIRNKSNKDMIDSQIRDAKKQRETYQTQLTQYLSSSEENIKGAKVVWNTALEKQLSTITGKKVKFKKSASGNVQMMIDGIKVGEPKSTKEMSKLVTKMIGKVTGKKGKAASAGRDLINGLNDGITDPTTLGKAYKNIENFGKELLRRLKKSLKEKSPSKATEEMGVYLVRGIKVGVQKERKYALDTVGDLGKQLLDKIAAHPEKAKTYGDKFVSSYTKGLTRAANLAKKNVKAAVKSVMNLDSIKKQTDKIKKQYKKFGEESIKAFNSAIDKVVKTTSNKLNNRISKLTDEMQKKVTEVNNKTADMRNKLSGYGGALFTTETSEANTQEIVRLTDLGDQIKDLKYYKYLINSLKKKVSKGLMNEITSMSIEDALKYGEQLNMMSDSQLKAYNKQYDEKQRLAKSISKNFYKDDLKQIKEDYTDKIKAEFKAARDSIKKMGKQAMQGFIKGMKSKTFAKDFQKISNSIVKAMKKALGINSPSRVFRDQIGKNVALGLGSGFTDTMAKISRKMVAAVPTEFNGRYNLDAVKAAQAQNAGTYNVNVTVNAGNINSDLDARRIGEKVGDGFVDEINRLRGAFAW